VAPLLLCGAIVTFVVVILRSIYTWYKSLVAIVVLTHDHSSLIHFEICILTEAFLGITITMRVKELVVGVLGLVVLVDSAGTVPNEAFTSTARYIQLYGIEKSLINALEVSAS
jgi:hypothetical protein